MARFIFTVSTGRCGEGSLTELSALGILLLAASAILAGVLWRLWARIRGSLPVAV